MAGLIVGLIDTFYNDLTDKRKGMFAMAVVDIFKKNPPKNMIVESITVIKKNPEADDD